MAYKDLEVGRARDRERFRRRSADRVAQGLCPRCGERPPVPERSLCEPCATKRNKSSRARDAKLRAAGKPRRDPDKERASERRRYRRQAGERREAGLCVRCATGPAAPGRTKCEPCIGKRREADRARYAEGKAAGNPYGGRNPETRRRNARVRSQRRHEARKAAGTCTRCGKHPPVEGGSVCEPCQEVRRERERAKWAERRADGLCGKCGVPVADGGSRCERCFEHQTGPAAKKAKNTRNRKLYVRRRVRNRCTDCGSPSQGASRCPPCARRSYERSGYFRGIPVWEPLYTVIEIETGIDHGTYDSPADVALCLAFARLSRDQVEVIRDAPLTASFTAWA